MHEITSTYISVETYSGARVTLPRQKISYDQDKLEKELSLLQNPTFTPPKQVVVKKEVHDLSQYEYRESDIKNKIHGLKRERVPENGPKKTVIKSIEEVEESLDEFDSNEESDKESHESTISPNRLKNDLPKTLYSIFLKFADTKKSWGDQTCSVIMKILICCLAWPHAATKVKEKYCWKKNMSSDDFSKEFLKHVHKAFNAFKGLLKKGPYKQEAENKKVTEYILPNLELLKTFLTTDGESTFKKNRNNLQECFHTVYLHLWIDGNDSSAIPVTSGPTSGRTESIRDQSNGAPRPEHITEEKEIVSIQVSIPTIVTALSPVTPTTQK